VDKNQVLAYLAQHNIDKIKFAFTDIDGILRGKVIHKDKFINGLQEGYGFCDVVFGWDSTDTAYGNAALTGWHTGYPDRPCRIDLSTQRQIPWQDNILFYLADFNNDAFCPRSLLRRIEHQCTDMGFHPEFAQEFEWFNFRETPDSLEAKQFTNLQPITPGMFGYSILRASMYSEFYYDLFNGCAKIDVPLEGLHTETGPGVYEAAILHDKVLAAADKAALFKNAAKEIAYRHGIMASFIAKWNVHLPGCSGHIHQSLWNSNRTKNLFYEASDPNHMSELFRHYLAGQLFCLPHIMPMYAPTVNSYKRLVEGAWAPTNVNWGYENRTTALRVIHPSAAYTRLETRIPGSDSNPYLAMAAALASGLYGIKNKLPLTIPPITGNGYADDTSSKLPSDLYDAAQEMKSSEIAAELFGKDFVDHFTHTRLWEWKQFSKHVTDWELKRYFEII